MKKFWKMVLGHPKIICILAGLTILIANVGLMIINAAYFVELELLMPTERYYTKDNFDYNAPSLTSFYPEVINRLEGMPKEWLVMSGSNSANGTKDIKMYYNLDTQEFTSTDPAVKARPIVEICLSGNWKRIEDLGDGDGIFNGKIRTLDAKKHTEFFTIDLPINDGFSETDMQFAIGFANDNYIGVGIDARQFYISVQTGDIMEIPPALVNYRYRYVSSDGNTVIGSKDQGEGSSLLVWKSLTNEQFSLDGLPKEFAYATQNLERLFYREVFMYGGIELSRYKAKVLDVKNRSNRTLYKTWDTIQIEANPWITNEVLGFTTRAVGVLFAREALVKVNAKTGDIVTRKIPLCISRQSNVYYDSAGDYAYFISNGKFYRVLMSHKS